MADLYLQGRPIVVFVTFHEIIIQTLRAEFKTVVVVDWLRKNKTLALDETGGRPGLYIFKTP